MKKHSFKGGIHPLHAQHEGKPATSGQAVRPFVPGSVCIPMDMHLGQPSKPCVQVGDTVKLGQVIGEAVGPRGIPVHASLSGKVTAVGEVTQPGRQSLCVTIQNDFKDEWAILSPLGDVETVAPDQVVAAIRAAGICGMGGACFPTHMKLTVPPNKPLDTIILNGAECETFLTSDHRLMLETPERVVKGLRAVMRALGAQRGVIAIEDNKPDAILTMQKVAEGREGVEVVTLKTKYPQGGEKQLITAVTGREVPSGGLPMNVGVVVLNVGTAAAVADAIEQGKPLISRITTVTGAVKNPSNLLLRIGTSIADAVGAAGGTSEEPGMIVFGGTMTGIAVPDDTVSVTKANNGIVVLTQGQAKEIRETQCIRCGRCVRVCPAGLSPYQLMALSERGEYDEADKAHARDCISCGACSYVCPAKRRLVASIKDAKDQLARRPKR